MTTAPAPTLRRVFVAPLVDVEWRESRAGKGQMTVAGHAAVFDRLSHNLGGFRETIAPGAFSDVLDTNPDVHALWDHDTSLVLARTLNKTLDLREDPQGLHFWARVAPTSYAADLRVLMERGDVDQASFAFTVGSDEWLIDESDEITRTVLAVDGLYDVTITAQGAYPQSDSGLRSFGRYYREDSRNLLVTAVREGRVAGLTEERAAVILGVGERRAGPSAYIADIFSDLQPQEHKDSQPETAAEDVAAPAEPVADEPAPPPHDEPVVAGDEHRSAAPPEGVAAADDSATEVANASTARTEAAEKRTQTIRAALELHYRFGKEK